MMMDNFFGIALTRRHTRDHSWSRADGCRRSEREKLVEILSLNIGRDYKQTKSLQMEELSAYVGRNYKRRKGLQTEEEIKNGGRDYQWRKRLQTEEDILSV